MNIIENLNWEPRKDSSITDINEITSNVENHVSIKKIKQSFPNIFNFQKVSREDIKKEVTNLNVKKSSTNGSILSDNFKAMCGSLSIVLNWSNKSYNNCK